MMVNIFNNQYNYLKEFVKESFVFKKNNLHF